MRRQSFISEIDRLMGKQTIFQMGKIIFMSEKEILSQIQKFLFWIIWVILTNYPAVRKEWSELVKEIRIPLMFS